MEMINEMNWDEQAVQNIGGIKLGKLENPDKNNKKKSRLG